MKRALSILISAVLIVSLSACIPQKSESGTATIVIATEEPSVYTVEFKEGDITSGLLSALDILEIEYDISGGFLNSVGDLKPTPPEYVYIYTSVLSDADTSAWATTMDYNGTTLKSVGVGADELHVTDGAIIYIGTIVYDL